ITELCRKPEGTPEQCGQHEDRDAAKQASAHQVAVFAPTDSIARGPDVRQEQIGKRDPRLLHQISSISCNALPPVSFRNAAVRWSSPLPASRRTSSTVPCAMILPFRMMLSRSHISCATSSV